MSEPFLDLIAEALRNSVGPLVSAGRLRMDEANAVTTALMDRLRAGLQDSFDLQNAAVVWHRLLKDTLQGDLVFDGVISREIADEIAEGLFHGIRPALRHRIRSRAS